MTPEQEAATIGPWVVRAGIAQATDLIAGAPVAVRQRSKACFATRDELAAAIGPTYVLHLFQSGSYVYHHELILSLAPAHAPTTYLAHLPPDAAAAISTALQQRLIDNPFQKGDQP